MKNDALNHFKEEMNKRGLLRKIQLHVNLCSLNGLIFKNN